MVRDRENNSFIFNLFLSIFCNVNTRYVNIEVQLCGSITFFSKMLTLQVVVIILWLLIVRVLKFYFLLRHSPSCVRTVRSRCLLSKREQIFCVRNPARLPKLLQNCSFGPYPRTTSLLLHGSLGSLGVIKQKTGVPWSIRTPRILKHW